MNTQHAGVMGKAPMVESLEAARGFAALYVTVAHLLQVLGFRSGEGAMPLLVEMIGGYAHQAVLFFFLLSGFSIHYASMHRPLDSVRGVWVYLLLRARRIYPIWLFVYVLAAGLIWLGREAGVPRYVDWWQGMSTWDWIANLLFLGDRSYVCGRLANAMPSTAVWSLGYEVIYYFLYPVFWWSTRRIGIHRTLLIVAAISAVAFALNEYQCHHLWNVMELYIGWCLGAWIAHQRRHGRHFSVGGPTLFLTGSGLLLAALVLGNTRFAVAVEALWLGLFFVMMAWHDSKAALQPMSIRSKYWAAAGMLGMVAMVLAIEQWRMFAPNHTLFQGRVLSFMAIGLVLLILSGQPSASRLQQALTRWLLPLGGLSYAQYLLHMPLIQAGQAWAGLTGVLSALPVILVGAYYLERRMQPWMNQKLPVAWPVSTGQVVTAAR
ncbi:acyltransferase [Chitinivorax sp. B]|uniref:acyltransferase family protein n=1 Tax=Chitinivorax sp. B TaxID=2502235 RepID=UPI001485B670|nr:acyltransferase [Chitinivorax sp. B]